MIVDPVQAFKTTTTATVPISTPTHVSPIPPIKTIPVDHQYATATGERTLWVVFVVMVIASIVFTGMAWSVPIGKRLYHVVTTLITVFAACSYFAMAVGDGIATKTTKVEHKGHYGEIHRSVYWARYVDWSVTTPLLLLDLALLAGLSGGNILIAIIADVIMVLTGLFAAFGSESNASQWGWYTIACIAYLVIVYQLVVAGRSSAARKGGKVGNFFAAIGGFTLVIWTVYPIIWGFADGSRTLNVDQEIIAYAVLDILAKPIFGAWLLFTHTSIPETTIDLGGFWSNGLTGEGAIRVGDDDDGA